MLPRPGHASGDLQVLLGVGHTVWTVVRAADVCGSAMLKRTNTLRRALQDASRALDQATQFGRVLRIEVTHNGACTRTLTCRRSVLCSAQRQCTEAVL